MPRGSPPGVRRGGRGPGAKNVASRPAKELIEQLARDCAPSAIAALQKICRDGRTEAAVVSAACALLDRGYGRPAQAIAVAAKHDLRAMSDAQLQALAASFTSGGAQGGGAARPGGFLAAPALAAPARPAGDLGDDGRD